VLAAVLAQADAEHVAAQQQAAAVVRADAEGSDPAAGAGLAQGLPVRWRGAGQDERQQAPQKRHATTPGSRHDSTLSTPPIHPGYAASADYRGRLALYAAAVRERCGPGVQMLDMTAIIEALYAAKKPVWEEVADRTPDGVPAVEAQPQHGRAQR